jgi:hypothetical protein
MRFRIALALAIMRGAGWLATAILPLEARAR